MQSVTHTLPSGYSQVWTLRTTADNGQVSTDTVTVQTDELAPSVQLTATLVFTKHINLLKGLAFDNSGLLRAVEISLNGGAFKQALLGDGSVLVNAPQAGSVTWEMQIDAANTDGDPLQIVAHAIDSAGNARPDSAPITITLDTTGPDITVGNAGSIISGTIGDGWA